MNHRNSASVVLVVVLGCHGPGSDAADYAGAGLAFDPPSSTNPDRTSYGVPSGSEAACEVEALLEARCVACHSPDGDLQGGLDLETDPVTALVDRPSAGYPDRTLVIPYDADGSFLLAKVEGTQGADGDPMPLPAGLDADGVAAVRAWIDEGAVGCEPPTGPDAS